MRNTTFCLVAKRKQTQYFNVNGYGYILEYIV